MNDDTDRDIDRRSVLKTTAAGGLMATAGCLGIFESGGELPDLQDQSHPDLDWTVDDVNMGGELVGTIGANINAMDPPNISDTTSSKTANLVYEGLTIVDFENQVQPCLAREWEQLDETTYEFSLHEGVQFHSGGEMTAEDVQNSMERFEDSPRHGDVYNWYDSSEVLDDYTIRINLFRPYAPFLTDVAGVSIVPLEADEEGSDIDLSTHPVGTGPYEFVEYREDDLFRVTRFDDYWFEGNDQVPGVAPIETVTLRIIPEQSSQLSALRAGDVDMVNTVDPEDIATLQDDEEFTVTQTFSPGFDMLIYPMQVGPFQNEKIRRGVTRLVPRQSVVQDVVFHGHAQEAAHPFSPALGDDFWDQEFHNRMAEEYVGEDEEAGLALLEEGFEEEGLDTPYQIDIMSNDNPVRVQWAEVIQNRLNETEYFDIGFREVDFATYVDFVLGEGSHENELLIALGWSGGADPDYQVNLLFKTDYHTPGCCNINHYANEEVDQLMDDGVETLETEERAEIYQEMGEILCRDSPMAFLWYGYSTEAVRHDKVINWRTFSTDGSETRAIYTPQIGQTVWIEE